MLVYICESFEIIVIVSLSVSIEKHVSAIPQSMILHTVIVTPSLFLFGLPLRVILWFEMLSLRIHWKLSTILEISSKSVWSNVFWYVKVCIFWKCIQFTIHLDKTNVKKKRYKKCPLFSFETSNSSQFYFKFAILIWAEAQGSSL